MSDRSVHRRSADQVAHITLDRPARANAIDLDVYRELCDALICAGDDPDVRVIMLTATGPDFSIGEDMEYLADLERTSRGAEWNRAYKGWIPVTWHNPKFVVACVRGRALGIGCELALLADVTFAGHSATFGHPEVQAGIVTHTIWPWLVGPKVAKEYLATGKSMTAQVAHQKGLINAAIEDSELDAHVSRFVNDLASMPAGTPGANKKRINWAYRDVSRVLHDDRFYDVDYDWLVTARQVDEAFYSKVAEQGVSTAVRGRDSGFTK
jgi:enoyl-CoA hydratase